MGKLVVTEFITLDGVISDPGGAEGTKQGGWSFRHPAPEGQEYKGAELEAADTQLLGRVTYQGFAAAWPQMEEQTGEFGKKMNAMPKYVVSTTMTQADATWNNTEIIADDVASRVEALKEQYAGDILVGGSATLVAFLHQHQLIDELRLMVHPVVLGEGKRLFAEGFPPGDFTLVDTTKAGPDVVLLTYRPTAT